MHIDWNAERRSQLDWHWHHQLRPRIEGLTDREYFREPAEDCWSVRPRGQSHTPMAAGVGDLVIDFAYPQPTPAPVTTIAWRIGHLVVGVFWMRLATHFAGRPVDYATHTYAGTATEALDQLDRAYTSWTEGVRSLDQGGLADPCGPGEGLFADWPMAWHPGSP